jgi:hypothetical protein
MTIASVNLRNSLATPWPGVGLCAAFTVFVVAAATLAAVLPLQAAIGIVFLFAGPHNLLEARFMLGRLPARAGRLRPFFATAVGGTVVLAAAFAALPWAARAGLDGGFLHAIWNAALCVWVAALVVLRSRTNPRFDAGWVPAAAMLVAVAQGPWPWVFGLGLVFLHPLMALAVLHRELRRSRQEWLPAWRCALATVPLGVVVIWAATSAGGNLVPRSEVEATVIRQAGVDILGLASARSVVAIHAFLELVHYGVWIVVLPAVGLGTSLWRIDTVPLARRGRAWARIVAAALAGGGLAVAALWACFCVDYTTTRHVYFTVAVLHVLAEIPFLIRMP